MMQQQQQRLKQQQIMNMMQYHPAAYLAAPQIEPILSGNLPPGFDPSTCRSVYVGNIHPSVTEPLLQQVFSSTGPIEGCKLIRKEKSSYGFVDYFDRRCAAHAILTLNGRPLFGQPIKVNWAYASSQREDTSGHYNIFVGDLSPEITDATLYACFSSYPTCSDARVMWDQKTGRSRGFGFVSFRSQQDAQSAINDLNDDGQDKKSDDAPENNPQYTTVYVGNLAPEVTSVDLHRHFHTFGAGIIEDVRVQRDKGFGFVRYSTHDEAALAIQIGNARIIYGKPIKCSWGSKPTPPGTSSTPLPPPAAAGGQIPGYSAAELMNYERQMAMSKMGSMQALMQQHVQTVMGMGGGGGAVGSSQAVYDGSGFPGVATSSQQQFMYYQ
ncbi:Oligouridylate-binding protein 1 [Linum perenne]